MAEKLFKVRTFVGGTFKSTKVAELEEVKKTPNGYTFLWSTVRKRILASDIMRVSTDFAISTTTLVFHTYCFEDQIMEAKKAVLDRMRFEAEKMRVDLQIINESLTELEAAEEEP